MPRKRLRLVLICISPSFTLRVSQGCSARPGLLDTKLIPSFSPRPLQHLQPFEHSVHNAPEKHRSQQIRQQHIHHRVSFWRLPQRRPVSHMTDPSSFPGHPRDSRYCKHLITLIKSAIFQLKFSSFPPPPASLLHSIRFTRLSF